MLNRLYGWYGKRVVRGVLGVLVILLVAGIVTSKSRSEVATTGVEEAQKPTVVVRAVSDLQSQSGFSVVGTVRAVSEARLETEANGRVTSVFVKTGDSVAPGTILATFENSAEQAQLLQAQGAYESALASSLQSGSSLGEAEVGARNAYRDAFSTADTVVRNSIDQFFSNPGSKIVGFRLTGTPDPIEQIRIREEIDSLLAVWSENVASDALTDRNAVEFLIEAERVITMISNFTTTLVSFVADEGVPTRLSDAEREAYAADLSGARAALDGALGSISRARDTFEQAKISSAEGTISQSSAREKSALGVLRSAQVNYEKTIVRSPIAGVVNAMYLRAGEFKNVGEPAALIANNGSLEIATALSEDDISMVRPGDLVRINNEAEGRVTNVAPAIDPTTGKVEVKIGVTDPEVLKNGSTVTITFVREISGATDGKISIPLSSVKLLPSGPVVFSVAEGDVLVSHPVVLGAITGESVEIVEGVTSDQEIVRDARGLKAGDYVTVSRN